MFRLKVPKEDYSRVKKALRVVDSIKYDYVLTTDKDQVEDDKINIVFSLDDIEQVSHLLDSIVKGENTFITGYGEIGQKNLEVKAIQYFIIETDDVYAVAGKSRFIVKMKLYELEDVLKDKYFIRVSKYALVNINKIDYIKPALNSKLILLMKNGDEVEVNRHYYKTFKKTLQI